MVWALGLAAHAGGRAARDVRIDGQGVSSRAAPRRTATRRRCSPRAASRPASAASKGRAGLPRCRPRRYDLSKVTEGLGIDFNLRRNTYKPYPCGIVNHPTIESVHRAPSRRTSSTPADIVAVRLRVAPLVLDLCNQQNITRGLQGKFSVYHGAAIGLVRGQAGLDEYTDAAVNDPAVKRVRERVTATGDPALTEDQAHVEVELADGRRVTWFVEQSLGNIHRPLSDRQLDDKFTRGAARALPADAADGRARSLLADRRTRRRRGAGRRDGARSSARMSRSNGSNDSNGRARRFDRSSACCACRWPSSAAASPPGQRDSDSARRGRHRVSAAAGDGEAPA